MGPDAMIFVFGMVRFKPAFTLSFFTFIKRFLGYSLLSAIRMMSSACCCCCPTLCDPIDSSLPGSSILGILQARTLEWVAISFSNAWKWKVKVKSLSHVQPFTTPWTAAYQDPPSMGFSRQEYWSGMPDMQYLGAISKMAEWSLFVSKANHSISQ